MRVKFAGVICCLCLVLPAAAQTNGPPAPKVSIEVRGEYRYITSNAIADHPTGQFPNRGNPNPISPQDYSFRVPVNPKAAAAITQLDRGPFGVAINGLLFDPGTAEYWQNDPSLDWRMEGIGGPRNLGLDQNNAHVQPNGAYHYHGIPIGLIEKLTKEGQIDKPLLLGWAADGYPIYGPMGWTDPNDPKSPLKKLTTSYRLKQGDRPAQPAAPGGKHDGQYTRDWEYVKALGDLDECNGRTGITPEFHDGTYYYVITSTFPFIPRAYHGTPDPSFQRGPGGRGPRAGRGAPPDGRRGGPPPGRRGGSQPSPF